MIEFSFIPIPKLSMNGIFLSGSENVSSATGLIREMKLFSRQMFSFEKYKSL